ncbi:MAG: NADH-quinone oxidoreductase subunit M [Pseudomonadota bacterium]|nr:NADH-quinone oxidoreductase subunit M [Pseudomonadota bacterium]MDP1906402.1 NADH-quinone oxidoreductase subunit M [Pseudomonadota bacterium]MDP2351463.1 NADH-quinone oxidoreductase subunit M [Pseudomonadota bacterium]
MASLSSLLLLYPVAAALIWLVPRAVSARVVALAANGVGLVLALLLLIAFDPTQSGFQLLERSAWIPSLNIDYAVGVDGISVLFLPATALLFLGVNLASWNTTRELPRLYHSLLLLQAGATLGVFCAVDTMLFFLFWELSLVPFYFLVSLWGIGPHRGYAATKYTLIMFAGGVPLLFGFLLLAFNHAALSGGLSFDLATLLATPLPDRLEWIVFLLLFLGFAVKTPVFPLHTWLPLLSMEGPVAVVALLTSLKLGAYGLIRFAVPLAPDAAQHLHWLLAGLGAFGLLYGAVTALVQTNLRAMLAYASISHVGLVLLGIASFNLQGVQGAVLQLLNFTLVAGGLFLITGFMQHRLGSTDLLSLGGAAKTMPLLASFFLFFGLASMGVPGTSGFPAELLILVSAIQTHTGAGLAALFAMVVGAGYFINLYRRAFLGPVTNPGVATAEDLRPRELGLLLAFALLILGFGLFPAPLLDVIRPAAEVWAGRFR